MTGGVNRPIGVIVFDLGNVLIQVDHMRFCTQVAAYGTATPAEVFGVVFGGSLEPFYDTGKISTAEFFQGVSEQLGLEIPFARFRQFWNEIFGPMPGMEAVTAHLKTKYPLFLLSNTNALHFDYILETFPFLLGFDEFVLSYEVGSRKPEAEIYRRLIEATGRPADQCLFIDDKEPFVRAAQENGLQAWQFWGREDLIARLQQAGLW